MSKLLFISASMSLILIFTGCQKEMKNIDLNEERQAIIKSLSDPIKTDLEEDLCKKFQDEEDMSLSCFYSRKNSTEIFNQILESMTNSGYNPISSIRQDYGAWSVLLSNDKVTTILRSASIDSAKSGTYLKYKKKGYHSKIDISVLPKKK